MITDIDAFLRYFGGVNRRAIRDVGSLPVEAESWRPPSGTGEKSWSIGQLVSHMAASRLFFLSAYCGDGWIPKPWSQPTRTREEWVAALTTSAAMMETKLAATPNEWLTRRVAGMDSPEQTIAGWRVLMMGVEHDVHHRSQIDTYAGIAGWEVQQIFGRKAEEVGLSPSA